MTPVEYIVENLGIEGVVDAYCPKRLVEGKEVVTGLIILVFDKYNLPNEVDAGYEKCKVKPYFPNPLRCKKCQKIGHTAKWCKSSIQICNKCAYEVPHDNCTRDYCVNCNLDTHASSDKNCPKFLSEKEIQKIRTIKKCSAFEARKEYYASIQARPLVPVTPKISFAEAAKAAEPLKTISVPNTFNFSTKNSTPFFTNAKVNTSKEIPKEGQSSKQVLPSKTSATKDIKAVSPKPSTSALNNTSDKMETDTGPFKSSINPKPQRRQNKKYTESPYNSDNNSSSTESKTNSKKRGGKKSRAFKNIDKLPSESGEEDLTAPGRYLHQKINKGNASEEPISLQACSVKISSINTINPVHTTNITNLMQQTNRPAKPITKHSELIYPELDPNIYLKVFQEEREEFDRYCLLSDKEEEV